MESQFYCHEGIHSILYEYDVLVFTTYFYPTIKSVFHILNVNRDIMNLD